MNEDEEYEVWRDGCDEQLQAAIEQFVEQYAKPEGAKNYFDGREDRIWKSMASISQNKITFN